ncbi:hypothetical protein N2152v2_009050 [Parachlorella kessleri]
MDPAETAVEALLAANSAAESCVAYLESLFTAELQQDRPDLAKLSIALGLCEAPLTAKQEANQQWPQGLQRHVESSLEVFESFVLQVHQQLHAAGALDSRGKVKAVADAVWSKLTGSFSKDILHAQHVSNFTALLLPGGVKGKRQLDCAGVVTTTFAVCQRLAQRHGHGDLAGCGMQVSEDHCWLTLDPDIPTAASSVEVTTDTATKRGLAATQEAWAGWLYTGGRAVTCPPRRAVAALVNSVNPTVTTGKNGRDSEQLQALQYCLLRLLWQKHRHLMYPAAICSLADLKEVVGQDELDAALAAGDQAHLTSLLQRTAEDAQELFESAIALAAGQEHRPPSFCEGGSNCPSERQEAAAAPSVAAPELRAAAAGATIPAAAAVSAPSLRSTASIAQQTVEAVGGVQGADEVVAGGSGALTDEGPNCVQDDTAMPPAGVAAGAAVASSAPETTLQQGASAHAGADAAAHACPAAGQQHQHQQQLDNRLLAGDPGWQWYPYSYLGGFLARRAEFLDKCASSFPSCSQEYTQMALSSLRDALHAVATGSAVLAKYRFNPAVDEQLYKDVEGALEFCLDGLTAAAAAVKSSGSSSGNGAALTDPTLLQPLLRLWDGICQLFTGKAKPGAWVALLLKAAKLFSPAAREAAAAAQQPRSEPMRSAQALWGPLKPAALRPVLESADVGQGEARAIKKPRR